MEHSSKVWLAREGPTGTELLTFVRADSDALNPQFDTWGGGMEPVDGSSYPGDAWILGYFSDTSLVLYSGYVDLHLLVSSIWILSADT